MYSIGQIIDYIGMHPKVILLIGVFHILAAEILQELQIPLIIMQSFQIGAWLITSIVGLITIVSWCHRVYKKYIKK
ncbi:MAG: hypothetical protein AABY22_23080 [Nanoarchaeota archaeon]